MREVPEKMSLQLPFFNLLVGIMVIVLGALAWPKWMSMTKTMFSDRVYFLLSARLRYSEIRSLFSGIFYLCYGVALMGMVILIVPPVEFIHFLKLEKAIQQPLEFTFETLLVFFAGISLIFVISNVIFTIQPQLRVTPRSYEDSWMEIYLQVSSRKILLISALFPVVIEELLFRWIATVLIYSVLVFLKPTYTLWGVDWISTLTGLGSTIVFCFQQAMFLRTREQLLTVLTGAFSIGFVNSIALLMGASIVSLIIVHYAYLMFFIGQQIIMRTKHGDIRL